MTRKQTNRAAARRDCAIQSRSRAQAGTRQLRAETTRTIALQALASEAAARRRRIRTNTTAAWPSERAPANQTHMVLFPLYWRAAARAPHRDWVVHAFCASNRKRRRRAATSRTSACKSIAMVVWVLYWRAAACALPWCCLHIIPFIFLHPTTAMCLCRFFIVERYPVYTRSVATKYETEVFSHEVRTHILQATHDLPSLLCHLELSKASCLRVCVMPCPVTKNSP